MTQEGDLVLVYMEGKPAFFARIEDILPDMKPEWFQVKMLVLQVPVVIITWILRTPYINGEEFTMGGNPVRMVKVIPPEEHQEASDKKSDKSGGRKKKDKPVSAEAQKGKVVSLSDRRKKD